MIHYITETLVLFIWIYPQQARHILRCTWLTFFLVRCWTQTWKRSWWTTACERSPTSPTSASLWSSWPGGGCCLRWEIKKFFLDWWLWFYWWHWIKTAMLGWGGGHSDRNNAKDDLSRLREWRGGLFKQSKDDFKFARLFLIAPLCLFSPTL